MAKTFAAEKTGSSENETKKQRKKLAKREAVLMLKVEQARKEIKKAEQKFIKAKSGLDAAQATLNELQQGLSEMRPPQQSSSEEKQVPASFSVQEAASAEQALDEQYSSVPAAQQLTFSDASASMEESSSTSEESVPAEAAPAEGRDDIAEDVEQEQQAAQHRSESTNTEPAPDQPKDIEPAEGRADITDDGDEQKTEERTEPAVEIESGGGSMPLETSDEHAWPPPQTREEVAEAFKEEAAHPANTQQES